MTVKDEPAASGIVALTTLAKPSAFAATRGAVANDEGISNVKGIA